LCPHRPFDSPKWVGVEEAFEVLAADVERRYRRQDGRLTIAYLPPEGAIPLRNLEESKGKPVVAVAIRLPGWTGGPGYFLGDRETFVIARQDDSLPAPQTWRPMVLRGRWLSDEWGTGWLQVEKTEVMVNY